MVPGRRGRDRAFSFRPQSLPKGGRMQNTLHMEFSEEERKVLFGLARLAIARELAEGRQLGRETPPPPPGPLHAPLGAFVTLKHGGCLRGCIGSVVGDGPLFRTVERMARAAAFEDPRFPPLRGDEFSEIAMEISVMGPITPCPDAQAVEVGRHGLIVRRGMHSGLLLPQVPVEWRWDRETFLGQTCHKAGLPEDCWREPQTQLFWFEACVLHETEGR